MKKEQLDELFECARMEYEKIIAEDPEAEFQCADGTFVDKAGALKELERVRIQSYEEHGYDYRSQEEIALDRAMSILDQGEE